MNRDDIIRMAQEAGLSATIVYDVGRMAREAGLSKTAAHYYEHDEPRIRLDGLHWNGELERFAALVAAATREQCAQVCDNMVMNGPVAEVQQRYNKAYTDCRDAVRALSD